MDPEEIELCAVKAFRKVPTDSSLTPRQIQVLRLIGYGYATKDTADALGVSYKTVDTFKQQLVERLGIHGSVRLARYAIFRGLCPIRAGEFE